MSSTPADNPELHLAESFIEQTWCNVFLTGKAGTGKTTFLKSLQQKSNKNLVVTAPTGVAAINAGGVTLHSFFQLPLGPIVPGSDMTQHGNRYQFKFSRDKKEIIKKLDLLIIDEISMVRADVLDAVDAVLRRYRSSALPFGGVQLLMIGDLHQLPPVVKRDEWEMLRSYYPSAYFFESKSLSQAGFVGIELKHIYRQTDEKFIHILNQVRDNELDEHSMAELNKRYEKGFIPRDDDDYITLTTHNNGAESLNHVRLQNLENDDYHFQAEIKGEFPPHGYPAPTELQLKKGAQVMFLRNDGSPDKRYFNGKIGKIVKIRLETIQVECKGDSTPIEVEPAIWENVKYTMNKEKTKIEAEVVGTFKQFPLKLAWAITIHKSQGLTFEKAIIDAEDAFAHGQTYVALSRCKTLEGVVLSSPISRNGIHLDQALKAFDYHFKRNQPSPELLLQARINYQRTLLLDCFDFKPVREQLNQLLYLIYDHPKALLEPELEVLKQISGNIDQQIVEIGEKFQRQLQQITQNGHLPESDPLVLERLNKASIWFQQQFNEVFGDFPENVRFDTSNALLKVKLEDELLRLQKEMAKKKEGIKTLEHGFDPATYQKRVAYAEANPVSSQTPKLTTIDYIETDYPDPDLLGKILHWRSEKANRLGISAEQVLRFGLVSEVAAESPDTINKLKKIKGVGKKTLKKYGDEIVEVVARYKKKKSKKKVASDTKKVSFELFKNGLSIEQISEDRGLVISTIETHLCHFIELGEIEIDQLVTREKQEAIEEQLISAGTHSLKMIREKLDNEVSYGEIKMVIARKKFLGV